MLYFGFGCGSSFGCVIDLFFGLFVSDSSFGLVAVIVWLLAMILPLVWLRF